MYHDLFIYINCFTGVNTPNLSPNLYKSINNKDLFTDTYIFHFLVKYLLKIYNQVN